VALAAVNRLPGAVTSGRSRLRRLGQGLVWCVGLPTLAAAVYYGLIASDVYIAEAKFTIRGDRPLASDGLSLALFGKSAGEDALVVREYIVSHGIVAELDRHGRLRAAYQHPEIDYLQRLPADASIEDLVKYFATMVDLRFDPESAVSTLRVRAYTPEDARRIASEILDLGERLVNRLSDRLTDDLLGFARAELARAEGRVTTARRALTAFRDRTEALDPTQEAGSILGIVTSLEGRLAQERAELMELRSFLREDSARIAAVKARIGALAAQIAEERSRLTGDGGGRLSQIVADYEELQLELEFARNAYTSALASLELGRAEAQRQQKYLIPIADPNLPDEPLEPRRLLGVLTVLLGSLVAYGVGLLVIAAVREHAEV
jgi:capsular polysaccharide transport system permease protein